MSDRRFRRVGSAEVLLERFHRCSCCSHVPRPGVRTAPAITYTSPRTTYGTRQKLELDRPSYYEQEAMEEEGVGRVVLFESEYVHVV